MLTHIYRYFLEKRRHENLLKREKFVALCPILSVGNITTGGTGKTPTVQWATRFLQAQGFKVGIACRGYKGALSEKGALATPHSNATEVGDEALFHAKNLPGAIVAIAKRRENAVEICVQNGANIVILDDGFQYWSLPRAFDLVLLDAKKPFGPNGKLLPLGRLREEPESLNRADAVLITRSENVNRVALESQIRTVTDAPLFWSVHAPLDLKNEKTGEVLPLGTLKNMRFDVCAGLADNSQFFAMLAPYQTRRKIGKSDHFDWGKIHFVPENFLPIVTTEKDAVKMNAKECPVPLFSLRIGLNVENEVELQNLLLAKLGAKL